MYFILTKEIFLHFFRHGNRFYNQYLNSVEKKYIDDDGSGDKPKFALQRRMRRYSCCDTIQAMFDRDMKVTKDNFGRKRKGTGCIYLPGSGFREAEGHL